MKTKPLFALFVAGCTFTSGRWNSLRDREWFPDRRIEDDG